MVEPDKENKTILKSGTIIFVVFCLISQIGVKAEGKRIRQELTNENKSGLRFDGLYQRKSGDYSIYFRFYADGTFEKAIVASRESLVNIAQKLNKSKTRGQYSLSGNLIKFSTSGSVGRTIRTTKYEGKIQESSIIFKLIETYNNNTITQEYHFVRIARTNKEAGKAASLNSKAENKPNQEQLEAFRTAKKVLIEVDQSYSEAEGFRPDPSIEDRTKEILSEFGFESVWSESDEYDLKLKISVKGTPYKVFWKRLNREIYTKASLKGSISFKSHGIPAYEEFFEKVFSSPTITKIMIVSDNRKIEEYFDRPSGAPFPFDAIWIELWETLGEIYGIDIIIREMQKKGTGGRTHAVAEALGNLKNPEAVESLLSALNTEDLTLNEKAAEALGKIGDPRAVEALIVCLKEWNYDRRHVVIEALGKIGDSRAIEPLIGLLRRNPMLLPNNQEKLAEEALIMITGAKSLTFNSRGEAQKWWEKNKALFLK